ncbi:cation diffusion facilitator CzcD-associated flavoprotein CzcO [Sphingomonas kaistensis]|uniref:Cation diffusion facilitator CzcD-associated flavoprotein CzcO n=1 Tax=Sphingomonas kaistensis TaxID=298708 RepID=A0A7X5Y7T8_9SPHN|nr:NAD(P)/FAD-dependent oxidoreductase [Sphingomonas kaistensis]NJC06724.1 cation diffusion facilitator CzcD-associated flavoprotein CzcO [Sphingomonas kaistensis]
MTTPPPSDCETDVDVLVVGAGLSGIGTAWHLQTYCPQHRYAIVEARGAIGGTWDLFRYPGLRSDSDMYTLGYSFEPWTEAKAIADGATILAYVNRVADKYGIRDKIRFGHKLVSADFDSRAARWTVSLETTDGLRTLTCRWLHMGTGYYDYDEAHCPAFAGAAGFTGAFFHAQFWPEGLDLAGRKVVVIGSGATAVTIVPELARQGAEHVAMLQRSPTYMVSHPSVDKAAGRIRRLLGDRLGHALVRTRNVLLQQAFYQLARRRPALTRRLLRKGLTRELPADYAIDTHFNPLYDPWDQRLCLVPDSDLFKGIREGKVSVVTDEVDRLTTDGVLLKSGQVLEADVIVAATGLKVRLLADAAFSIDGEQRKLGGAMTYKGMMFGGIPNLSYSFGYTNASWTLKADLSSRYLCRLLNRLAAKGQSIAVPEPDPRVQAVRFLDFTSGYLRRAEAMLPVQGDRGPWKLHQNYARDVLALRFGRIDDGVMRFSERAERQPPLPTLSAGAT